MYHIYDMYVCSSTVQYIIIVVCRLQHNVNVNVNVTDVFNRSTYDTFWIGSMGWDGWWSFLSLFNPRLIKKSVSTKYNAQCMLVVSMIFKPPLWWLDGGCTVHIQYAVQYLKQHRQLILLYRYRCGRG